MKEGCCIKHSECSNRVEKRYIENIYHNPREWEAMEVKIFHSLGAEEYQWPIYKNKMVWNLLRCWFGYSGIDKKTGGHLDNSQWKSCVCISNGSSLFSSENFHRIGFIFTDLSCWADAFPDAEIAGHPAGQEAKQHLPFYCTRLLYSCGYGQHLSPVESKQRWLAMHKYLTRT